MSVLVTGSIGIDDVKTPHAEKKDLLGGSASYAALSASFFSPVHLVGVVGRDFPQQHIDLFTQHNISLDCLEIAEGNTFRWSGEYFGDLNTRETLDVQLNVLETFNPQLSEEAQQAPILLLANSSPETQLSVLQQSQNPQFVIADTMDLWINIAWEPLSELFQKLDLLVINDSEAKQITKTNNLITAGHQLRHLGPKNVVIKKGEHGALLFGEEQFFSCSAYPLTEIHDPTGAGDCFAGGLAGYLAEKNQRPTFEDLKHAIVHGSIIASYNCESFSTHKLQTLTRKDIDDRYRELKTFAAF